MLEKLMLLPSDKTMHEFNETFSLPKTDESTLGAMGVPGIAEVELLWKMENPGSVGSCAILDKHNCLDFSSVNCRVWKKILKTDDFSNMFAFQDFKNLTHTSVDFMFFFLVLCRLAQSNMCGHLDEQLYDLLHIQI